MLGGGGPHVTPPFLVPVRVPLIERGPDLRQLAGACLADAPVQGSHDRPLSESHRPFLCALDWFFGCCLRYAAGTPPPATASSARLRASARSDAPSLTPMPLAIFMAICSACAPDRSCICWKS